MVASKSKRNAQGGSKKAGVVSKKPRAHGVDDGAIDHEADPHFFNYVVYRSDGFVQYNGQSGNLDGTFRRVVNHFLYLKRVFDDPDNKKRVQQRQVYEDIIAYLRRAPGKNWVKWVVVATGQTSAHAHNHELAFMHENMRRNPSSCSNVNKGRPVGQLRDDTARFEAYAKKVYENSMLIAKAYSKGGLTIHDLEDPKFLEKASFQHYKRCGGRRVCAQDGCNNDSKGQTFCLKHN